MRSILCALLFVVILAGCRDESTNAAASTPYEKWVAQRARNYSIEQVRACFCVYGGQKMKVIVRSDTIYSVMRIADSVFLLPPASKYYLTVDSLFAIIKKPGGDSLVVSYDPQYGFPESLDINPQMHPFDGGVLYETSKYQPD